MSSSNVSWHVYLNDLVDTERRALIVTDCDQDVAHGIEEKRSYVVVDVYNKYKEENADVLDEVQVCNLAKNAEDRRSHVFVGGNDQIWNVYVMEERWYIHVGGGNQTQNAYVMEERSYVHIHVGGGDQTQSVYVVEERRSYVHIHVGGGDQTENVYVVEERRSYVQVHVGGGDRTHEIESRIYVHVDESNQT